MSGWFAVKRGAHRHPLFRKNPERFFVWTWMISTAAWKDTRMDVNGKPVAVRRGQLLTSYRQLADETGVGIQVIRTLIGRLQDERAIDTSTNTGRMLITIRNYDTYQSPVRSTNKPENTQPTHSQHTKEQDNHVTNTPPSEDAAEPPFRITSLKKTVWNEGKEYLGKLGVKNPGGLIGKWISATNATAVLAAIEAAQEAETQDPIPYITAILEGSNGRGHSATRAADERFASTLEQIARTAGLGET